MASNNTWKNPPRTIETQYERDVRREYLIPFFQGLLVELRKHPYLTTIGWIGVIDNYTTAWNRNKRNKIPIASIRSWAETLDARHKALFIRGFKRAFQVDIRPVLNSAQIRPILEESIEWSVSLISKIDVEAKQRITDAYIKQEAKSPLDLKSRERMFRNEIKASGYRLRRITRDQSNKLSGNLTQARHEMAGIQEYEWDTSEDDRVRPTHAQKNGKIFRWDQPPPDTGHPGHDIQCRCVAIPKVVAEELRQRVRR